MDGYRAAVTLSVARNADRAELRRAFRARAKQLHPDAGPTGSELAFIQLREAFDHLMAIAPETASPTRESQRSEPQRPEPHRQPQRTAPPRPAAPRFEVFRAEPRPIVDVADAQQRRCHLSPSRRPVDLERDARGRRFADHLEAAQATVDLAARLSCRRDADRTR